jgi:hypothetical protein
MCARWRIWLREGLVVVVVVDCVFACMGELVRGGVSLGRSVQSVEGAFGSIRRPRAHGSALHLAYPLSALNLRR